MQRRRPDAVRLGGYEPVDERARLILEGVVGGCGQRHGEEEVELLAAPDRRAGELPVPEHGHRLEDDLGLSAARIAGPPASPLPRAASDRQSQSRSAAEE